MLQDFLDFVAQQQLISTEKPLLLAISGGVDSVVMSALFARAKFPFAIAHCNFALRGEASEQDQAWTAQLAAQYGVSFYTHRFATRAYAQSMGISVQMAARKLRRDWLETLCTQHCFHAVALAHHGDDSWETVLLNLTRGTGLMGLRGIQPAHGVWIRPLLFAHKERILRYAIKHGLSWREDASNAQLAYKRNVVRHQIVPRLKRLNPNLSVTSRYTIERISQTARFFTEKVACLRAQSVSARGPCWYVSMKPFVQKEWAGAVLAEILGVWGFCFGQIERLLRSDAVSGSWIESPHYRLYTDRHRWIVCPKPSQATSVSHTMACKDHLITAGVYTLTARASVPIQNYRLSTSTDQIGLDQDQLAFPLKIRRWQPGDRFVPLGMSGRKKVSDFLIDTKVPVPEKDHVYVLETADKQIAWVAGYRIDDRFKLTDATRRVYDLRLRSRIDPSDDPPVFCGS